jgi:hypothetical protein
MLVKKYFLVGIITLLSMSLVISAQPVHPTTGEPLVIDCLRGTPDAIDGDLSDWNLEAMTPAVLDAAEQLFSGQDSWTDSQDCSGEFYLLWDDENIYIAVVAKDDVLSMNKTGGDIWNADAVEVFFATTNAVAGHDEHYQYGFNANNQRWNWCNMDGAGGVEPDYLQIASSLTADGYICEAAIPYAQMPSLDFSAGNIIGFHPVFDDTDNGDRELQMTWIGLEAHDQSMGFGHMLLSEDSVAAPEELEMTVLFTEDFEGVTLGPNVDETLAGDAVWTDTPPEGWIVDESGIPGLNLDATDGMTEWAGWAFVDKAWWIEAAEDQDRSMFELGSGVVAVADPDEWDDGERLPIPIAVDPYDTWLTTPEIKIGAAAAGTLELKFDSSWRPEFDDDYHQTANITASFDGGDPVEVMLWESDEASPNYKPYATNETVVVKLDNPEGAKRVVLTFGLFDAGNDWWWAIDNIEVRGYVPSLDPVKPSTEGLVAYYAMDGDLTDSSGNGLDGTAVGDPTFAEGQIGMALDLDGVDDYVDCSDNELFSITDAFTLSLWINWRATGATWQTVIAKGDNAWRLARGGDTQTMDFGFTDGGPRGWLSVATASDVPLGEWHHVTATIDTIEGAKIYLDGVLEGENPDTGGITVGSFNYPVFIGENSQATGRFWNGLIDEVMIYNRVLSDAEIRYLAGERAMPIDPGSNGLLAWWACDEGEGDVVADVSGNGRDGVFVNGDPAWVEGVYGNAVELVGPTLIETPPLDLELTEATMAGWIKPNGPQPDWSSIIMQRDPGLATGFNILGYQLAYHWNDTSSSWNFRGGDMIAEDDWTFAAVTIEPDQATFYVNGEAGSVNEITHEPCLWNSNVYLGGDGTAGWVARRMNGALDEVVIYDRALSVGEIRYLAGFRPPLIAAFAFGSRDLVCPTYNIPSINYTIVLHESPEAVQYDPARGYGYEVLYPADSPYGDRAGYGIFGPFDDSPNGRNKFPDELPEEIYDSFIGAKSFLDDCSAAVMGDMDTPCDVPEGIIFRVDVPNGLYRFVAAFGDADNVHAHRILAEDGGSGPPENIGANHVVLVSNHDQAQQTIGEAEAAEPGEGVFARVGFDGKIPPPGDGVAPSPQFIDMDENGMPTEAGANSPVLEVTQGYIRIHQLQGNSNDGPGGPRDANGGDIVILELWKVD